MSHHLSEIRWMDDIDDQDQDERHRRQEYCGEPTFRREGAHPQSKLNSTSQQEREPVKDLGQVSPSLALDVDRNGKKREIHLSHAPGEVIECYFLLQPERDLVRQNSELTSNWI